MGVQQVDTLWSNPVLVYGVAICAILLLVATVWLFRRKKREGRGAGIICLVLSVILHVALIWMLPYQPVPHGGSSATAEQAIDQVGVDDVTFSTYDESLDPADHSGDTDHPSIAPLPVDQLDDPDGDPEPLPADPPEPQPAEVPQPDPIAEMDLSVAPPEASSESVLDDIANELDQVFGELLETQMELTESGAAETEMNAATVNTEAPIPNSTDTIASDANQPVAQREASTHNPASVQSVSAPVPGNVQNEFANRTGAAKERAIIETGGDLRTEAAVAAALRFLAEAQRRQDGAWDPRASGAGVERKPLGESRPGAGTQCESGITGLALLAMMGAGNTHLKGEYADNVYRGLAYLIQTQRRNGSLGGNATLYASTYCHSMASLAMCEAAAITKDRSAIESSRRAIDYSLQLQHPVTGGWRYTKGDSGDLSQLGWQAMVLDSGRRAGIPIDPNALRGMNRFLISTRAGRGGLACYRPGSAKSRTMTAEALATRLLMGETVPDVEIREAEQYLLEELPGTRADNYYYWYYATLALHQLQDDAWDRWNQALKQRLLETQRPDGSWPTSTTWGGYGGTIYTTSMATLCLETYYRHSLRRAKGRVATETSSSRESIQKR